MRTAVFTAALAAAGFIGGAVLRDSPGAQDPPYQAAAALEPRPPAHEGALPHDSTAEPEPIHFAERPPHPSATVSPDAVGAASPQDLANSELRQAVELYRKGDIAGGDRVKAGFINPADRDLSEWVAVRFGSVGFDRIVAFARDNPDWPAMTALSQRAEEALLGARKPAAFVRALFAQQQPTTAAAKVALALTLKSEGGEREAAALLRDTWRNETFGREFEAKLLDWFPGVLTPADHLDRMERLLMRENWTSALRVAGYAGDDYVLVAKARAAVGQKAADAQRALDAVPSGLTHKSSFLLGKVQLLRRQDQLDQAIRILADPLIVRDGDGWWVERRLIARKLLDLGNANAAYALARRHAAETAEKRIDAEFHAGWIALRFLNHPATAGRHFAEAAKIAVKPVSVARIAYWQGRAAEAGGRQSEARAFYEKAAPYSITYYGQLARAKLGLPEVELRSVEWDARAKAKTSPVVQAVQRLYEIGYSEIASVLCADLAASVTDAGELDSLAQTVATKGDARTLLAIGKTAVQRGYPLDSHAFPLLGLPTLERVGSPVEEAMVYAITRQESEFAPDVQSSAGARGLMQLMPDTARRTAKRFGVEFDVGRLLEPAYNAQLGAAHLGELMQDWKGSHILMFASYNAGGGNVSKWIKAYGDPRSPHIDPIDWVERIPFSETRNYVQRVMEGLLVYRHRLVGRDRSARRNEAGLPRANPVP